jgi:beta-glucanase (GH16 family)
LYRIAAAFVLLVVTAAGCGDSGRAAAPPSAAQSSAAPTTPGPPGSDPAGSRAEVTRTAGPSLAPGWGQPVLAEDFTGSRVNSRKWVVYDSPDASSNPRTAAATKVSGGSLWLTGGIYGGRNLSGGIASHLALTYGRWEVRMRAERGPYSSVALLWPTRMGHPEWAEIDFAEIVDFTRRSGYQFIHYGPQDRQAGHLTRADFRKWHVVALDWLPNHLTFWLDGKKIWTYRGPLIPKRADMHLALQNDQICDRGPASCRNRNSPKWTTMYVDWVRVYRFNR